MTAAPYVPFVGPAVTDAAPPSFVIELTEFSGPLDLLLTLIREEQVDIYDIPIARVAEQFLARIRTLPLNDAADYLEMAARLLRIKEGVFWTDRRRDAPGGRHHSQDHGREIRLEECLRRIKKEAPSVIQS